VTPIRSRPIRLAQLPPAGVRACSCGRGEMTDTSPVRLGLIVVASGTVAGAPSRSPPANARSRPRCRPQAQVPYLQPPDLRERDARRLNHVVGHGDVRDKRGPVDTRRAARPWSRERPIIKRTSAANSAAALPSVHGMCSRLALSWIALLRRWQPRKSKTSVCPTTVVSYTGVGQ